MKTHLKAFFYIQLACFPMLSFPMLSFASPIQDHRFAHIDHPKMETVLEEISLLLDDGSIDLLIEKSDEAQLWLESSELAPRKQAYVLNNLAISLAQIGDADKALVAVNKAVGLLETISPFDPDLYHVMMTKGYVLVWDESHIEAEDTLRHAQHIAHRNQGVYGKAQLPALRLLTKVQNRIGQGRDADQTQRFLLKVNEQLHGEGSEEMIPSLGEVGRYFANRGRAMPSGQARTQSVFMVGRNRTIELDGPEVDIAYRSRIFRESQTAYNRSLEIIEAKYGPTDLRLVAPLKGLSQTKLFEGFSRGYAEKPMEKMVEIVHQNPGSDAADKAKALVELGDLYIKTEDLRATDTYKKAWAMLAGAEHEELRYQLFGKPVRLVPDFNFRPTLLRYPVSIEPNQQLFVSIDYTVAENGRVRQANVVDGNIPMRDQKDTKSAVQYMKFRPRIVEGEVVATDGLSLHQTFTVYKPEPEFSIELKAGS